MIGAMGWRAAAVAGFVVLAIVGAACADDGDASGPGTTSTSTTTTSTTTTTTTATTSSATTSTTTIDDHCSITVPDDATHLAIDRTPLDVDQDGTPDEILVSETADGHRIHVMLAAGTAWADVSGSEWPRLLDRPEGGAAGRDLDGDGLLDFFLAPMSTNGAELVRVAACGGTVGEIGPHEGEWCIRDGGFHCDRRIACVGDAVLSDMTYGGDVEGLEEHEWVWSRWQNRFVDDELVATRSAAAQYLLTDPPPGVPTPADADTVDCSPDDDAELATVAAPGVCVGTGDRPADATLVAEIDLDGDDASDRIVSWEAASGAPDGWLHVELAHGVTEPIAIPYNWGGGPDFMAGNDVDGDGVLEVFLMGPSNTAHNAFAVQLLDCTVQVIDFADEPSGEPSQRGLLLHGIGGNSCNPTGCQARVTCSATGIVAEQTGANDHRNEQFDPDDPEMFWWRIDYALEDGQWQTIEARTDYYRHADPPADSPQVLGSGLYC